jgi:hypothetical protein
MIFELSLAAAALGLLVALRVVLLLLLGRGRPMEAGGGPVKTMVVLGSGARRRPRRAPRPAPPRRAQGATRRALARPASQAATRRRC